jgi:hypothetical protein
MRKSILIGLLLALAACGGGDTGNGGDSSGACLPGDENCADDPSGGSDGPADPSATLSVAEVLAAGTIDGPFVVRGYLFVDAAGDAVLCDMILESYPPQCGGSSIPVSGPLPLDDLVSDQGRQWSNDPIDLEGTFDGTTFQTRS